MLIWYATQKWSQKRVIHDKFKYMLQSHKMLNIQQVGSFTVVDWYWPTCTVNAVLEVSAFRQLIKTTFLVIHSLNNYVSTD